MENNRYTLRLKSIQTGSLTSLTDQTWYDPNDNVIPWSGSNGVYIGPEVNEVVYNSGSLSEGYYKWGGTSWSTITREQAYDTYDLPVYLESMADEMGGMVGFDGDIQQVELLCNFNYQITGGNTVRLYNSIDRDSLKIIVNETFDVDWGDGNTDTINVGTGNNLAFLQHTYDVSTCVLSGGSATEDDYNSFGETTGCTYNVSISLNNSWTNKKTTKKIRVPKNVSVSNPNGTFGPFTIPYTSLTYDPGQKYINDLDITDNDSDATLCFAGMGRSRISELKKYGQNTYNGVTTGTDSDGLTYSGYTIDNLTYRDYDDGHTRITGTTTSFEQEEVFNKMLTRNEHFIGFIDEPSIYSDVFVERGKQGVLEMNLRLGELDNVGEISLYGNGFFNVKKQ